MIGGEKVDLSVYGFDEIDKILLIAAKWASIYCPSCPEKTLQTKVLTENNRKVTLMKIFMESISKYKLQ